MEDSRSVRQCPMCDYLCPSQRLFVSHLRLVHSQDPGFSVVCDIDQCTQTYRSFSAFNSHIYRVHRVELGLEKPVVVEPTVAVPTPAHSSSCVIVDQNDSDGEHHSMVCSVAQQSIWWNPSQPSSRCLDPGLEGRIRTAEFLLLLSEGRHLSQVALNDVIKGCRNACHQSLSLAKEGVLIALSDAGVPSVDVPGLYASFSTVPDPFEGIDTVYMRERFYKKHFNYLEPQEIPFGSPFFTDQFSGPKRRKVRKTHNFYYVPLLDTLKTLLTINDIQAEVINSHQCENNELHDFCDGQLFRSHPLFMSEKNALQIIGYYDELEVVNPIGSYVSKHKLGCLFFTLGNIRPQYRSSLKAINLVAVGKYEDIRNYGIDTFLSPFVDDLKTLFCDGIEIKIGDRPCIVFGGLLAFLADNLAAHAVGGFKESMSFSLRICRTCMITPVESQTTFTESMCQLRTPDRHFNECLMLEGPLGSHYSTNFGINRRSILEDVPGFSVVTGIPHDIMHDLFEGVVPYELKLLICYCVQKKYFSIDTLNERIERFDFVYDKPSMLDSNLCRTLTKIRQSASQMMALSWYFPILIGDKVPESDEHWVSFLLLLKICNLAVTPICMNDTVPYLRILIEEKLSSFKKLYPESKLIPKFHYMLHYPTQIKQFGPLIHSWTMRQESKLSFVKRVSRRGNFKNIPQTVAKKHQLWQCYKIQLERTYLHNQYECSPKTTPCVLEVEDEHVIQEVHRLFPSIESSTEILHPDWVKNLSSVYRKGVFLLLKYDAMSPEFGKIIDILYLNDTVIFSLKVFISDVFVSHYNCYMVRATPSLLALSLDMLSFSHPLYSKHSFLAADRNLYIVLPFSF